MKIGLVMLLAGAFLPAFGQDALNYEFKASGSGSSGDFAPYYIGSECQGRYTGKGSALAEVAAHVSLDSAKRFSWGAGADVITGYSTKAIYERYYAPEDVWGTSRVGAPAAWVQQLYGELKYRGVQLVVGQRDHHSAFLPQGLTSGDLTRSANARGIPGAALGFIDFQNIPFTKGWVQIDGVVEYGKTTDYGFKKRQFNYYTGIITGGTWYTYKRCYFRTKPSIPLSFTVGMQTAGQFGGWSERYRQGKLMAKEVRGTRLKDFFKMFFPIEGNGNSYYEGNSLGSWDFKARYRFSGGQELTFAFEWPWEDGSGIGMRNGWDGVWGLYYTTPGRPMISGAAIEYLDFRSHSGPIHFSTEMHPGTTIPGEASGGDNLYNNDTYGSYANYGMSIGTPFLVSPVYNLNGYPMFGHNVARGVHLAVNGYLAPKISYALRYSWQQGWGVSRIHSTGSLTDNSLLMGIKWDLERYARGWKASVDLGVDQGRLRGNSFGVLASISYSGSLKFRK